MKFRIGHHKLMIETGRYDQIPRINGLCSTCGSNQIDDKMHLLLHCTKYSVYRDQLYKKIEYHLPNIKKLPPTEATKKLMNSANCYVNVQLTKFVLTCLDLPNTL